MPIDFKVQFKAYNAKLRTNFKMTQKLEYWDSNKFFTKF